MATSRVKGITIEIGGDTTGLDKALSGVNKEINGTKKELKDVEKLLKMDPGNTELLRQKQEALKNEVAQTSDKLQTLKNAQAEVTRQYENGDIDKGAYDAFQREIIATENELKNLQRELAESNVIAQKLANAGEGMKTFGGNVEKAGRSLMPLSTAVAGIGAAAVKVTADFDASMSKVAAVSGATGESFEKLRAKAREMGANTKFSASEAADAMNYMAMAGWKTEDMLDGIDGIMNLAAASGEDLALTSDIVTDALSAFGEKADQAGRLSDILASASSNANTNVAMMGESFKYAANTAGSMGYSMEDTAIALGLMANTGVKASRGGTALNNIMTRMAKKTKESGAAMNQLGLSLDDGKGNMYSFMDIMKQLRAGFGQLKMDEKEFSTEMESLADQFEAGELSEKEFDKAQEVLIERAYGATGALNAQYAAMLAGKTGMGALLAIVNASDEDFNKLTEAVNNSAGTAQNMADVMQDNLSGQLTILMSQLQELAIQFGDMMMPVLRNCVEWLQKFMDKLNGMDEGTRTAILQVGLFVAALGPVLIIVGKVVTAIGSILTLVPKVIGGLSMLKGAFTALWAVIVANPIVAIAAAIVGLVVLIGTKGDEIKAIIQKVDDFLQNVFAKDWTEVFGPVLGGVINKFMSTFKEQWDSLKRILDGIIDFIRGVFTGDWERALNGLKTIFGNVFNSLVSLALSPINKIISKINSMFSGINGISAKVGASIQIPKIPMLASGGIVSGGSAIVGEAGAELLSVSNGRATVQPLSNGGNAGHTDITELLQTYLPYLAEGNQIILDSGALVGATAPAMNTALGRIAVRAGAR